MFDYRDQYLDLEKEVLGAVQRVLRSGELILGSEVKKFESGFSDFLGYDTHSLGVANGTDALVICLMALGVGPIKTQFLTQDAKDPTKVEESVVWEAKITKVG